MDVRRRDERIRARDHFEDDAFAARLRSGLAEDEPLACDGVLDLISCAEHDLHLLVIDTKSVRERRAEIVGRKRDSRSFMRVISASSPRPTPPRREE
jgi:hypothetical protein